MEEKTPMELRRLEKGVTKAFIAKQIGLTRAYTTNIFNGHSRMQEDILEKIAGILEMNSEDLKAWQVQKFGILHQYPGRPRKGGTP